jgi:hypothetical protein
MPEITIRAELEYDTFGGPTFSRFLPLRDAATWVPLGNTRFEVRLYTDPTKHRGWVTDIDLHQIDKYANPSTKGMFIELRTTVDEGMAGAIANAFEKSEAREGTHEFSAEVLDALRAVHRIFVGFVRHDYMQYRLHPWEDHRFSEAVDQRLGWYDARWQMPDGLWKCLHPQCSKCITPIVVVQRQTIALTKDAWALLEAALKDGSYRAKPHRRLLANAFAQFDRNELRAAIIEGIAAWEMVLGSLVPLRLAEERVVFDANKWRALLEKTGLRAGTDLTFALMPQLAGTHGAQVVGAIEHRNNVIHNGAMRLEAREIEQCLWALRAVIANCEGGGVF